MSHLKFRSITDHETRDDAPASFRFPGRAREDAGRADLSAAVDEAFGRVQGAMDNLSEAFEEMQPIPFRPKSFSFTPFDPDNGPRAA